METEKITALVNELIYDEQISRELILKLIELISKLIKKKLESEYTGATATSRSSTCPVSKTSFFGAVSGVSAGGSTLDSTGEESFRTLYRISLPTCGSHILEEFSNLCKNLENFDSRETFFGNHSKNALLLEATAASGVPVLFATVAYRKLVFMRYRAPVLPLILSSHRDKT